MHDEESPASCRLRDRSLSSLLGTSLVHRAQLSAAPLALWSTSLRAAVTRQEREEEVGRVTRDRPPSGSRTHTVTVRRDVIISSDYTIT